MLILLKMIESIDMTPCVISFLVIYYTTFVRRDFKPFCVKFRPVGLKSLNKTFLLYEKCSFRERNVPFAKGTFLSVYSHTGHDTAVAFRPHPFINFRLWQFKRQKLTAPYLPRDCFRNLVHIMCTEKIEP